MRLSSGLDGFERHTLYASDCRHSARRRSDTRRTTCSSHTTTTVVTYAGARYAYVRYSSALGASQTRSRS
jgi:hypothetical protein